jgi:RHS repeat-associated protein
VAGRHDATNRVYLRNRYYDPETGRFTQEDPIGLAGGVNSYGFAGGDPVNYSDPFGLCPPGVKSVSAQGVGNSVVIQCANKQDEVRSGGSRAWRNNNPGNLEAGGFSTAHGSVGGAGGKTNDRFAVFPDENTGKNALSDLLFTSSYENGTLNHAIDQFAPGFENNTAAYQASVTNAVGASGSTPMSAINVNGVQHDAVVGAISQHEGWIPGTITYRPHQDQ